MERIEWQVAACAAVLYLLALESVTGDKASNLQHFCCSQYNREIGKKYFCLMKSYNKGSMCGSGKEAIIFRGKKSESFCADPTEKWVKNLQNFLDRKVKCVRKGKGPARKLPTVEKRVASAFAGSVGPTQRTDVTWTSNRGFGYSTGDPFSPALTRPNGQLDAEDPSLTLTPVTESTGQGVGAAMNHVRGDCGMGVSESQRENCPNPTESQNDEGTVVKETYGSTTAAIAVGLIMVILLGVVYSCTQRRRGRKRADAIGKDGTEGETMARN
ncbi:uncharacterized protein LOC119958420 isoform X2 [Scyliorhinus canicula]|uniref:uncharacterized protein LOC119958420 isoform X2 n=1 Tax=Scyliorhinus canicula TaxID=7830 RepID=UPI0018F52B26|nr:uncharacterized protein LOC119958420 isoform X2 [Scyliorhinus canicula]